MSKSTRDYAKMGYPGHIGSGPSYNAGIRNTVTVMSGSQIGDRGSWNTMYYRDGTFRTSSENWHAGQKLTFWSYQGGGSYGHVSGTRVYLKVYPFGR